MMTDLEKLKAEFDKQNGKRDFTPFDYNNRTFKPEIGETRVRILPQEDTPIFFLADGYHVMSQKNYQDCPDTETCPVCKTLRKLWDDNDTLRQGVYRSIWIFRRKLPPTPV